MISGSGRHATMKPFLSFFCLFLLPFFLFPIFLSLSLFLFLFLLLLLFQSPSQVMSENRLLLRVGLALSRRGKEGMGTPLLSLSLYGWQPMANQANRKPATEETRGSNAR